MLVKIRKSHEDNQWVLFDNCENVEFNHTVFSTDNYLDLISYIENERLSFDVYNDEDVLRLFRPYLLDGIQSEKFKMDDYVAEHGTLPVITDSDRDKAKIKIANDIDFTAHIFINCVKFIRNGVRKIVFFYTEAYVCNDQGKTIERIHAG